MDRRQSSQERVPYVEAVSAHGARPWLRGCVPGHGGDPVRFQALAGLVGAPLLSFDVPALLDGIDLGRSPTPLEESLELAATAWGAARTWFLTGGASQGNRIAALASRALGSGMAVQRSAHSSLIDGLVLSGARAVFISPSVDTRLGISHGIDSIALRQALSESPDTSAAYVVSPSYFGAVSEVTALAEAAHDAGVPLIVDEAWGAHFGFHPKLPLNAVRCGADLVISSTHKLGGSLTQSAMLHLGHGAMAEALEPFVERAYKLTQSTSPSSILLASLDLARRALVTGTDSIGASIDVANRARNEIVLRGRFRLVSDYAQLPRTVAGFDPLRISVDTRIGGISGRHAQQLLREQDSILTEVATDGAIVAVVGAGAMPELTRFVTALHRLPVQPCTDGGRASLMLPSPGPAVVTPREAYFADSEVVHGSHAVGRISVDSLAAYPPGIPNVLPGEVITRDVVEFLQHTSAAPDGFVRGALDARVSAFRVMRT